MAMMGHGASMPGRNSRAPAAEPPALPDAPDGMSANLQTAGVPPLGAGAGTQATPPREGPGEVAFDRWLHRELSRLYDQALSEPVPEDLLKLLREPEGKKD